MMQLRIRLQQAVRRLTADGPLKSRLARAYGEHLQGLEDVELPEDLRAGFVRLREAMHRHRPVTGQSSIDASVRKLSSVEAEALAELVVDMLVAVARGGTAAERLKVIGGGREQEPEVPPALLVDRR